MPFSAAKRVCKQARTWRKGLGAALFAESQEHKWFLHKTPCMAKTSEQQASHKPESF